MSRYEQRRRQRLENPEVRAGYQEADADPDEMTQKDIARWYHENKMEYLKDNWGPRDENGESASKQVQLPEYATKEGGGSSAVRSTDPTPGGDSAWWWEEQELMWEQRSPDEQQWIDALDDFFAPYIAMLPRPKGNLIREVFNDRHTYVEVGKDNQFYDRQAARKAVQRAVRDLTKLIAQDDPMFRPPLDGRQRDFEAEQRAARRVFVLYLNRREV